MRYIIHGVEDVTEQIRAEEQLEAVLVNEEVLREPGPDRPGPPRHGDRAASSPADWSWRGSPRARPCPAVDPRDLEKVIADLDETIREIRVTIFGLAGGGPSSDSLRSQVLELVTQSQRTLGFVPERALRRTGRHGVSRRGGRAAPGGGS